MTESAVHSPSGRRRVAIIAVLALVVLVLLVLVVSPIVLKRAPGWTGILILGTYQNQNEGSQHEYLCPLTVTNDQGVEQHGYPVQDGGSLWTRFDAPSGHYTIQNPNILIHDVNVWPLSHSIIDMHNDFGCISNGLNTN
jgi:hypothetical protein